MRSNTLIDDTGHWTGHVDMGDLGVVDRWADLAIASLSLDWNFGEGHQQELFDAYGIAPDRDRIRYYRALRACVLMVPHWCYPPVQ